MVGVAPTFLLGFIKVVRVRLQDGLWVGVLFVEMRLVDCLGGASPLAIRTLSVVPGRRSLMLEDDAVPLSSATRGCCVVSSEDMVVRGKND